MLQLFSIPNFDSTCLLNVATVFDCSFCSLCPATPAMNSSTPSSPATRFTSPRLPISRWVNISYLLGTYLLPVLIYFLLSCFSSMYKKRTDLWSALAGIERGTTSCCPIACCGSAALSASPRLSGNSHKCIAFVSKPLTTATACPFICLLNVLPSDSLPRMP